MTDKSLTTPIEAYGVIIRGVIFRSLPHDGASLMTNCFLMKSKFYILFGRMCTYGYLHSKFPMLHVSPLAR